jgi:hypothetical protein
MNENELEVDDELEPEFVAEIEKRMLENDKFVEVDLDKL